MKHSWLALAFVPLLLCACDTREAPAGPDAAATPPPAAMPPASGVDTATTPADPPAPAPVQPTATTSPATPPAGDAAVNAAIDAALGDHARYQAVITALQAAVAAGDAAAVARLAHYPIGVDIAGRNVLLRNEQEFVARYPEFMTPDIREAIVGTKYADLFVNYKGVMFGRGQAWINGICNDDACTTFEARLVTLQPGPE